jgi:hypothetical protein
MPLYHATYKSRIDSILKYGLGGMVLERNFPEAEMGTYLCDNPVIALGFLIEHYVDSGNREITPDQMVKSFRVIVIDDTRFDQRKLRQDPQIDHHEVGLWVTDEIIDINGCIILDSDMVMAGMNI